MQSVIDVGPRVLGLLCLSEIMFTVNLSFGWGFVRLTLSTYPTRSVPDTCACALCALYLLH